MKLSFVPLLTAVALLAVAPLVSAGDAKADLDGLVEKVRAKIKAGEKSETELAEELKTFDTLLAEHKDEKTDDVAKIAFMKALLYVEVLGNPGKALPLLKQVQADYPETHFGKQAPILIAQLQQPSDAEQKQKDLVGNPLPDFEAKDLEGNPLSIASRKGKVVLLDFWATWCGPCVAELPNVLKAYEKYHDKGFEIIGISLDSDKDTLTAFIKDKKMAWPQYFDGSGGKNKIATQYGIDRIPATYLVDKEGKVIATELRGEALGAAVEKALGK